jgi:hypothetical protein
MAALLLVFVAACGGDDDDDGGDATSTTGSAATTATSGTSAPTTTGASAEATAERDTTATTSSGSESTQPAGGATGTSDASTDATATEDSSAEASPTSASAESTATGDSASTPGSTEDPLDEVETLDPEALPNFTLVANIRVANIEETSTETTIILEIQQAAVDNYHLLIDPGDGTGVIESWQVGDRSWTGTGGVITENPEGVPNFFGPSLFLQQLPNLAEEMNAERIGEEEISGRETTHYRASAEEMLRLMQEEDETGYLEGATDPEGEADIWVDNEHKIMIRARVDVSWTNTDGTTGEIVEDYDIFDIGDTPEIPAPQ